MDFLQLCHIIVAGCCVSRDAKREGSNDKWLSSPRLESVSECIFKMQEQGDKIG